MNTSQPKLFTQEYALNRIEANWKIYNNIAPEYDISFDATILKLYTHAEEENKEASDKIRNGFGVTTEKLRRKLLNEELNKELIVSILNVNFNDFLNHLDTDFSKISEKLRRGRSKNIIQLLMLMESEGSISAEKASAILEVSSRTVENYIAKLKKLNIIKREGSDKLGRWILNIDNNIE